MSQTPAPPVHDGPSGDTGDGPVPTPVEIEVDGVTLRVLELPGPGRADEPTFVLLHGIGMSHRSLDRLAVRLAREGRVIWFDLAGFGRNATPRRRIRIEDHARLVAQALDRLGAQRLVPVGHSMGAQIALELGLIAPDAVDAVVLVGPVVDPHRRSVAVQAALLGRDSAKEPASTNGIVLSDYIRGGIIWYLRQLREMFAYRTDLRAVGQTRPLLVVRGEDDPVAQTRWCEELVAHGRPGRLAVVPGTRHVVPHTAPQVLADEVAAFVAEIRGARWARP